jgi:hypothetical protein
MKGTILLLRVITVVIQVADLGHPAGWHLPLALLLLWASIALEQVKR